jgi:Flp pilus assembly CpaF family ATPase
MSSNRWCYCFNEDLLNAKTYCADDDIINGKAAVITDHAVAICSALLSGRTGSGREVAY